jgi:hypothetical protein
MNFYCDIPNEVPHEIHKASKEFPELHYRIVVSWETGKKHVIGYEYMPFDTEAELARMWQDDLEARYGHQPGMGDMND